VKAAFLICDMAKGASSSRPEYPSDQGLPQSRPAQITPGSTRLERAQEVDDVLPLTRLQAIEMVDDLICLAILALVGFDSLH
jgi:hypothetical protein